MTDTTTALKDRPLRNDDELRDLLETLLEKANRRQLWILFIDDRGCLGDPLIPFADYPEEPHEMISVPDLGDVTEAEAIIQRAGAMCEVTGNVAVVLAWERIGSSVVGFDDRDWARATHEAALEGGIPLRAQFLLHNHGVRQLQADDYLRI